MINNSDKQVGLYSGGLIFGGGAYIWNEGVSVSTYGGLIHVGAYTRGGGGGLIFGGLRYALTMHRIFLGFANLGRNDKYSVA